ncbi:copper resistance protein CopC [Nocardioides zeae]
MATIRRAGEALEGQDTSTGLAWRVDYRVVSADGHPVTGTIEFSAPAAVAEPEELVVPVPTRPADPAARGRGTQTTGLSARVRRPRPDSGRPRHSSPASRSCSSAHWAWPCVGA